MSIKQVQTAVRETAAESRAEKALSLVLRKMDQELDPDARHKEFYVDEATKTVDWIAQSSDDASAQSAAETIATKIGLLGYKGWTVKVTNRQLYDGDNPDRTKWQGRVTSSVERASDGQDTFNVSFSYDDKGGRASHTVKLTKLKDADHARQVFNSKVASKYPNAKVTRVVKASAAREHASSADNGLYAVKGYVGVITEDEWEVLDVVEGVLETAMTKPTLKEALGYIDPAELDLGPKGVRTVTAFLKKYYRPNARVFVFRSDNVQAASVCAFAVGQVKIITKGVYDPSSFFRLLPKFAGLISGCKVIRVGQNGDSGIWQRSKDEFIVYMGTNN